MKKKTDWRAKLENLQIHTKTGREKFLVEVADAYCALYPNRADFFRRSLKELRKVTTDGYQAGRHGHMYCQMRVPTELWLFIQRYVPDFGQDSSDVELLTKVWSDLVPARDRRPRTKIYTEKYGNLARETGTPAATEAP